MRRYIAPLVVLAALLVSSVAYGATATTKSTHVVKPVTIKVTLGDYFIKFSKASVKKGTPVIFKVHNAGTVQHNLDLVGYKRTPIIGAGANTTLKVTFKKHASIQAVCDVPRHIQLGMVSTFKVL